VSEPTLGDRRLQGLRRYLDAERRAREATGVYMRNHYPIGGPIAWERNGLHQGTLLALSQHPPGDSVKVRNDATGKQYWVDTRSLRS
jgi:hypothetical protein